MKLDAAYIFLIVYLFASVAKGQQSAINSDEYEKAIDTARTVSNRRNRRVTTVIETRTRGRITSTESHVEEHVPPNRERFVDTITSGDVTATEEVIQIGRSGFQKKDSAPWVEWTGQPFRGIGPGSHFRCSEGLAELCSYTSVEAGLDGRIVRLISRVGEMNIGGLPARAANKVWISGEGALLKSEMLIREGASKEWTKRIVSKWEYDPVGIEIKAPQF